MLALITIERIKIEDDLVLSAKDPRSKVIDLTCFRGEMQERCRGARGRAHVVFARVHRN